MNKILDLSRKDCVTISDTYQLPFIIVEAYIDYLREHITGVIKVGNQIGVDSELLDIHDASKLTTYELPQYIKKFGFVEYVPATDEFNRAWWHHIKNNPHHWEYWVIPGTKTAVEMEYKYIREMVADWHGAQFAMHGDYDCSEWLAKKLPTLILHENTRAYLTQLLNDLGYITS